jgi:hypothetical protein
VQSKKPAIAEDKNCLTRFELTFVEKSDIMQQMKSTLNAKKGEIFDHFVRFYGKKYRDDLEISFNPLQIMESPDLNVRGFLDFTVEQNGKKLKYAPEIWLLKRPCSTRDYTIIHEMEHAAASKLVTGKRNYFVCGAREFDLIKDENGYKPNMETSVNLCNFDEAITETLSLKHTAVMHREGLFLRDKKDDYMGRIAGINGVKKFKTHVALAHEFYDENREAIIESRLKKEPQILIDHIGKERYAAELCKYN